MNRIFVTKFEVIWPSITKLWCF